MVTTQPAGHIDLDLERSREVDHLLLKALCAYRHRWARLRTDDGGPQPLRAVHKLPQRARLRPRHHHRVGRQLEGSRLTRLYRAAGEEQRVAELAAVAAAPADADGGRVKGGAGGRTTVRFSFPRSPALFRLRHPPTTHAGTGTNSRHTNFGR